MILRAPFDFEITNPPPAMGDFCPVCLTYNGPLSPAFGCCADCEAAGLEWQRDEDYAAWAAEQDKKWQDYRRLDLSDEYHPDELNDSSGAWWN